MNGFKQYCVHGYELEGTAMRANSCPVCSTAAPFYPVGTSDGTYADDDAERVFLRQENARLAREVGELREALQNVVLALSPPEVVFIGHRCNRYAVTYGADGNDPIKEAAALLAPKGEQKG